MNTEYEIVEKYLRYDEYSPTKLSWLEGAIVVRGKIHPKYAGSLSQGVIVINQIRFPIRNVVWWIHNKSLPMDGMIKHLDGDTKNNSISNLYLYKHETYEYKLGEHLREYLKYDENSPSKLVWIKKWGLAGSSIKVGDFAGSLDNYDGYWKLKSFGQHMKCHRIVWYLFNGDIPEGKHIDHINGKRSDNSIENLRVVEPKFNFRNRSKSKNNTTGISGVSYHEGFTRKGTPFSKFYVHIDFDNGERKQRSFSIQKYGYDNALKLASDWREEMLILANSQNAGYTPRHGKE